jgi:hypothetical protein
MTAEVELRRAETEKRKIQAHIRKALEAGEPPNEKDKKSLEKVRRRIKELGDLAYLESLKDSVSFMEERIKRKAR